MGREVPRSDYYVESLPEPIPFELGLQIPRHIRAEVSEEGHLRQDTREARSDLSWARPPEGVQDRRGEARRRPCPHVPRDPAQILRLFGHRVPEGQGRHRHRPDVGKGAELRRRELLGARVCRLDRRLRS